MVDKETQRLFNISEILNLSMIIALQNKTAL